MSDGYKPNGEQRAIIAAHRTGESLVVQAGAGTGKTSTLQFMARSTPARKMLYLAYNKAIQVDAATKFPSNVTCKTSHGQAYGVIGINYRGRLNGPRVPSRQAAQILGIVRPETVVDELLGPMVLQPYKLAQLVTRTVDRFCHSADPEVSERHVPWVPGLGGAEARAQIEQLIVPLARAAWKDMLSPDGRLKFTHDAYLKMYQMSKPRLPFGTILLDEAQDTNECVADIVISQQERGAQLHLVGDSCQAIYGWRGAVDFMDKVDGRVLQLTGSYRFGPAIAEEANRWLDLIGSPLRLKGFKQINSVVDDGSDALAVLTRTNGQSIAEVMAALERGTRVALVGGGGQIAAMARAAAQLQAGGGTEHPELIAFSTWDEVVRYTKEDPSGSDLLPFVQMVTAHGPDAILRATERLSSEEGAELIVSTAHKAKGREWDSVRIGPDFKVPKDGGVPPKDEMMLNYVAETRARFALQRGSLGAIDAIAPKPAAVHEEAADPVLAAIAAGPWAPGELEEFKALLATAPQPRKEEV